MRNVIMAALLLAVSSSVSLAQTSPDDKSLSDKTMKDQPGTTGGATANPTAKPESGSLSDKAMKDQPGTKGGMTDDPTAKPDSGSLSDKAMKDQPGVN